MVEKNLDFRSDTVTLPTPEMREAAANALLGDDVEQEDPTVNELERLAAEMLGKEAGLFVTSGTQGNAVSVLAHTQRGDEIILEARSHIYMNEVGGLAVVGGLMPRTIPGELGWIRPEDIEAALRPPNIHYPITTLLCVENTHNAAGGIALTPEQMKSDWAVAKRHDMAVHIDGARIFNAAVALGVDVKELARYGDSVQFCLSKGLSAPVGSVVVGDEEFIEKARKYRKMFGGGMRQAGIIAAPGIVALKTMVDRLAEDHENARLLAEGLRRIKGMKILNPVMTNMVYIDVSGLGWTGQQWADACAKIGWRSRGRTTTIRLCTHYGIEREDIEAFLEGIGKLVPKR
ncbi:threonine aldolase [miscellaneous Crenarchaeota group-15 archaeon DG-45]|uniref:Threonine aldolase n=1 Tax=miscellaneous Crenarchaeota group-15 archaeon DG-45 TaxID=1685127 RepID=A0A0M0BQY0_9ARCH|nr:MAG: threonine aldolase [miscellaneous Crenarchaeota group-15 archaeon DG-45]